MRRADPRAACTAAISAAALTLAVVGAALPAAADHSDPQVAPGPVPRLVVPQPAQGAVAQGAGTWEFVNNVGPLQGTDIEYFRQDGATYAAVGTLGQAPGGQSLIVGQRLLKLTDEEGVPLRTPQVMADHGSGQCDNPTTSATGLQHDVQVVPLEQGRLLADTTDATGRCHDQVGGGLELVDIADLTAPVEVALIRLNGLSHTVTADRDRPGVFYNNGSDFGSANGAGMPWIDVVDARSCLDPGTAGASVEAKRDACRPEVFRMAWDPDLTKKRGTDGELVGGPSNCHDTTYRDGTLYCAALSATLIMDVTGMFDDDGRIQGEPLPCSLVTTGVSRTDAPVTDCVQPQTGSRNPSAADSLAAWQALGSPQATGWSVLQSVNHPGVDCTNGQTACNTNLVVPSDQGVAVAHEADPSHDGRFVFVTDERGGGVVPPGATCAPGLDNPVGNGGIHVFDRTAVDEHGTMAYALDPVGEKAVFIGTSPTPSALFCTVHVIEHVPGEQRIVAAYYDGGTKIIDYEVDGDGRVSFQEVAAYRLPGANTWTSEVFHTADNADGTRTYWFGSSSFALGSGTARGFDVFTWTGAPNPVPAASGPGGEDEGKGKEGKGKADKGKDGAPGQGGDRPGKGPDGDRPGHGAGNGGGDDGPRVAGATALALASDSSPWWGLDADAALLALAVVLLPLALGVRLSRRRLD